MNAKLKELVEKLIEKSREGKAIWERMSGGLKLSLSSCTVFIRCVDDDESDISIEVRDKKGNEVGRFRSNQLRELYCSARGTLYNPEESYKLLMEEINNNDIIGGKEL
jgi:hypothetical protein